MEYDHIVNEMGEVRKHLDAWLEVSKHVIETGDEADLKITLELTLEWLISMTNLALDTYAEMLAIVIERDEGQVTDSVLDPDTKGTDG